MFQLTKHNGFTLVEMIVVISLISIILFVSVPRVQDVLLTDNTRKFSRWIINRVRSLKNSSVQNQKLYVLNVDLDENRFRVSSIVGSEEEARASVQATYQVPDEINILSVEYPGRGKISSGKTEICFYKRGYSDKVLIHIENDKREHRSYLIEPFMHHVKIYEYHVEFEN